ncbi:MAG: hypothetical protein RBS49_04945 [Sphaerochaeta sp.]|jgi:hypothetical protein|nr:hypothetical protein [Sphaerochaeta sp.]
MRGVTEFLPGLCNTKDLAKGRQLMDVLEYHDLVGKEMALKAAELHRRLTRR